MLARGVERFPRFPISAKHSHFTLWNTFATLPAGRASGDALQHALAGGDVSVLLLAAPLLVAACSLTHLHRLRQCASGSLSSDAACERHHDCDDGGGGSATGSFCRALFIIFVNQHFINTFAYRFIVKVHNTPPFDYRTITLKESWN